VAVRIRGPIAIMMLLRKFLSLQSEGPLVGNVWFMSGFFYVCYIRLVGSSFIVFYNCFGFAIRSIPFNMAELGRWSRAANAFDMIQYYQSFNRRGLRLRGGGATVDASFQYDVVLARGEDDRPIPPLGDSRLMRPWPSLGHSGLDRLRELRAIVETRNACALPGCTFKYNTPMHCLGYRSTVVKC
jgi:hypothetical protein